MIAPSNWPVCGNPTFGFRFNYPDGWINVPDIPSIVYHPKDAVSFAEARAGGSQRVFSPALTLMMWPRGKTAGKTPSEAFGEFKQLLPGYFADCALRSEEPVRLVSGHEAVEIGFVFAKGTRQFQTVLWYVVQPQFIFIFDGSALQADFPAHESVLRTALGTLRLDSTAAEDQTQNAVVRTESAKVEAAPASPALPRSVEIEAASLHEAREMLRRELSENVAVLKEEILRRGGEVIVDASADSVEDAYKKAEGELPAGVTIVKREIVASPRREVRPIVAPDEATARTVINMRSGESIESVTLKTKGKKGFFGYGRMMPGYSVAVRCGAKARITYTQPAKIRALLGAPVCCDRCAKRVLREVEYLEECSKAGLVLVNGNLYGNDNSGGKVEIYEQLQNQKGFQCSSCSTVYCLACLFNFAPSHPNGGKACFKCKNRLRQYE